LCQGLNLRRGPLLGLCVVQPTLSLDRDRRVVALEVGVRLVGGVHVLLDRAVLADVHVTIGYSLLIEVTKQRGRLTDRHVQVDAPIPAHSAAGLRGDGLADGVWIPHNGQPPICESANVNKPPPMTPNVAAIPASFPVSFPLDCSRVRMRSSWSAWSLTTSPRVVSIRCTVCSTPRTVS